MSRPLDGVTVVSLEQPFAAHFYTPQLADLDARVADARMNDMHEMWQHPQLHARSHWTEGGTAAEPTAVRLQTDVTDASTPGMNPVPGLGQHSVAIVESLGCSRTNVQVLRRAGVI